MQALMILALFTQDPMLPAYDYVKREGWDYLGLSELTDNPPLIMGQPTGQPNRIWVRYEWPEGDDARSARTMVELDCDGWRTRELSGSTFSGPNMSGEAEPYGQSSWYPARPDTMRERYLQYGCED